MDWFLKGLLRIKLEQLVLFVLTWCTKTSSFVSFLKKKQCNRLPPVSFSTQQNENMESSEEIILSAW